MKPITDTGVRGYLKWLQQDQPNLYKAIAPHLVQRSPHAFSDHEQSLALGALALADDAAASGTTTTFDASTDPFSGASAPATDVASAANVGAASPSFVQDVENLITGVLQTKAAVDLQQAQTDQLIALNKAQLQIAAAGGTPLMTSSTSLGIPSIKAVTPVGATIGLGTVAVLAVAAWFLLGRSRRA